MPFWLVKLSVSPLRKPPATDTWASVRLPLLSTSFTVSALSSVTGVLLPPVNCTSAPALTVGATCTVPTVLVTAAEVAVPSLPDQLMVREASTPPLVGSPLLGLKL